MLIGPSKNEMLLFFKPFVNDISRAYSKPALGVDILTRDVEVSTGQFATLSIWLIDQHFKPKFLNFDETSLIFYKGAAGIVIVFDLCKESSYEEAKKIHIKAINTIGVIPLLLIGFNLERIENIGLVVDRDEARHFTEFHSGKYLETTKLKGEGVDEALLELTKNIIESRK